MGKQYTVRNIPDEVDDAIRKRAKSKDQSLNTTVIEQLKKALGVSKTREAYHDLDWFVGAGNLDDDFEQRVDEMFEQVDREAWQ